jgi:hypothetical protein
MKGVIQKDFLNMDPSFMKWVNLWGPSKHGHGESHDQADAEWIVIRTQLRSHNDTPFGRPAPRPPRVWLPFGHILYVLVTIN